MNVRTPLLQRIQIKNLTKKALNTKKEMEYQKNIRKERLRYLYERRRSYEKAEATISEYKSKYQDDNFNAALNHAKNLNGKNLGQLIFELQQLKENKNERNVV